MVGPERRQEHRLAIALHRLNRSYEEDSFLEQMVDLAVGLEATLLDGMENKVGCAGMIADEHLPTRSESTEAC
jgi:hypothetical protein